MNTIRSDLQHLLALPKWTPLSLTLVDGFKSDRLICGSLYELEVGIYLRTSPFCSKKLERGSNGPYITGVLWAVDSGAAKRAVALEIESDSGREVAAIPVQFLPEHSATTYEQILTALRRQKPTVCQESAAYRLATDGAFLFRTIETEQACFYFRSREFNGEERPFAVLKKLLEAIAGCPRE